MDDIININFNGINGETFFNLFTNNIIIQIISDSNVLLFNDSYKINYYVDNTQNKKRYYIKRIY